MTTGLKTEIVYRIIWHSRIWHCIDLPSLTCTSELNKVYATLFTSGLEGNEVHLTVEQARSELPNVIQCLFERTFAWVVAKFNECLSVKSTKWEFGSVVTLNVIDCPSNG